MRVWLSSSAGHKKELTAEASCFPRVKNVPAYGSAQTRHLADQALKACYHYIALTTISSVVTQKVINIRLFLSSVSRSLVRNPNKVWASQFLGLALLR